MLYRISLAAALFFGLLQGGLAAENQPKTLDEDFTYVSNYARFAGGCATIDLVQACVDRTAPDILTVKDPSVMISGEEVPGKFVSYSCDGVFVFNRKTRHIDTTPTKCPALNPEKRAQMDDPLKKLAALDLAHVAITIYYNEKRDEKAVAHKGQPI